MIDPSCLTYRKALLVGEADASHAASCDACARFRNEQREVADLVRACRPASSAPDALRTRVAAGLEAARSRAPAPRRWTRRALVVGAAVAIAAAVAATWSPHHDGAARADRLADRLVADYLEYAHRADKTQVASTSPAALEAWYADELHIAATVPQLRGARILGGRHCKLDGRSAALTFFELPGRGGAPPTPLSLFVFEPHGEDWSHMTRVAGLPGKRKACRHERRGVALLVWQERGLDYALAGAVDSEELVELVR